MALADKVKYKGVQSWDEGNRVECCQILVCHSFLFFTEQQEHADMPRLLLSARKVKGRHGLKKKGEISCNFWESEEKGWRSENFWRLVFLKSGSLLSHSLLSQSVTQHLAVKELLQIVSDYLAFSCQSPAALSVFQHLQYRQRLLNLWEQTKGIISTIMLTSYIISRYIFQLCNSLQHMIIYVLNIFTKFCLVTETI
jgi:hypothetical protein